MRQAQAQVETYRATKSLDRLLFADSYAIWRLARENRAARYRSGHELEKEQDSRHNPFSRCRRGRNYTRGDAARKELFLALRSDILALAFSEPRVREEMFAAFAARQPITHLIWVARGKPKSSRHNERVVAEFRRAIKKALIWSIATTSCGSFSRLRCIRSDRAKSTQRIQSQKHAAPAGSDTAEEFRPWRTTSRINSFRATAAQKVSPKYPLWRLQRPVQLTSRYTDLRVSALTSSDSQSLS